MVLAVTRFQRAMVAARGRAGHSQWDAAYFLGCRGETVSRWERGVTAPSDELWARVAGYLGVSEEELMVMANTLETGPKKPKAERMSELQRLRKEIQEAEEVLDRYGIPRGISLWRRCALLASRGGKE